MGRLCKFYGITPQTHYQALRHGRLKDQASDVVVKLVRKIRKRHPRMGTRKLLQELRPSMQRAGIKMGRDRLFALLRSKSMLVQHRRRKRRTTYAGWWRCEDLLKGTTISAVNQAWVSDITYLDSDEGASYLSLITDVHSRYIVGYNVSRSLSADGALAALKMACQTKYATQAKTVVSTKTVETIHHSDRGVQYTCLAYRQKLEQNGMKSSMGEAGNCYDNAIAERVNGILKQEYALGDRFQNHSQIEGAVRQAIWLYNHERPHLSLGYCKPVQVYLKSSIKV